MLTIYDWHTRFSQQAQWTADLRKYIFDTVSIQSAASILDVGCGTGALEPDLRAFTKASINALDIDFSRLQFAKNIFDGNWVNGDGVTLPFADNSFDFSLCHYLMLWLPKPLSVLVEMKRVTCPGGHILLLAEPDYTHRVDFPQELAQIGEMQSKSLSTQGANPGIGSSIGGLLHQAGIQVVEVGLSGGQWRPGGQSIETNLEWKTIRADLGENLPTQTLDDMEQLDIQARSTGERILYVPTFYAIGQVVK
jgi:SAM-dependent methyltransferase